jgi:hypothetical protein
VADRERRPTDLVTKRHDPNTRPAGDRHDPSTGPRGRPRKLHSAVARDIPKDLQPAAATRAPDPLAAAEEIGVIKARHDDSGPGPGEPESHNGGRNGSDRHDTPDPATAGGGAHDGSGDGGGADVTRPGDGGDDFYPSATNYTADAVGFGRLLAVLRRGADMTQFQLGVDSRLRAISKTYIARIENGDRMPSRAQAHDLFVALRVPDALREQYLAHFYPPVDTTPTNYPADAVGFGRLLAALHDSAHMTDKQLATAAGVQTEYVKQILKAATSQACQDSGNSGVRSISTGHHVSKRSATSTVTAIQSLIIPTLIPMKSGTSGVWSTPRRAVRRSAHSAT